MNKKEIAEIKRRQKRDRSNMTKIYGCYVNDKKEIITEFSRSTATMSENEAEKYFALLRRSLGGTLGKNLLDITFRTAQVADSVELSASWRCAGRGSTMTRHAVHSIGRSSRASRWKETT